MTTQQKLEREKYKSSTTKMLAASVSSNMMTPLNGILNFSQILMKPSAKMPEKKRQETAYLINSSAKLLQCHTKDLLDLNLLETGLLEPNLHNANIRRTIEEIIDIARMQASLC